MSYVSPLREFSFNTDEIDAENVMSPYLPVKRWSHGRRLRIKHPHSRCTLMLKHTALVDDEQRWQVATVPGYLGGRISGCRE